MLYKDKDVATQFKHATFDTNYFFFNSVNIIYCQSEVLFQH